MEKQRKAILFDVIKPNTVETSEKEILKKQKQKWEEIEYEIIDQIICSHEKDFEDLFKEAIAETKRRSNCTLAISKFSILPKKTEYFEWLKASKVSFRIYDFGSLNQDRLDVLIDFLKMQNLEKSRKITNALKDKKAKGYKLGNPNIGERNVQEPAKIKRILSALRDLNNQKARRRVSELREDENLNFNRIAKQLNEEGYKTRRGKGFHAKSVQRIYNSQKELETRFELTEKFKTIFQNQNVLIENFQTPPRRVPVQEIQSDMNYLMIRLDKVLAESIVLTIGNHEGEKVYTGLIKTGNKEYTIDLLEENKFLPGLHYVRLEAENWQSALYSVKIMEELL